jgi:hypothetical protein
MRRYIQEEQIRTGSPTIQRSRSSVMRDARTRWPSKWVNALLPLLHVISVIVFLFVIMFLYSIYDFGPLFYTQPVYIPGIVFSV